MARFDDLPADQQAVLRLLLTQDTTYEEIARNLRMAPAAVRDRAYEALGALGPAGSAPEHGARAAIGDYLLGQREDAPAELSAGGSVQAWADGVRAELDSVPGAAKAPAAPGATGAAATTFGAATTPAAESPATTASAPRGSRVGGAILLTGAAIVAALAIGFFVGRASKDDSPQTATKTKTTATASNIIGQANLQPTKNANAPGALGIAQFAHQSGKDKINVIAEHLPKVAKGTGYGVWLISDKLAPVFLGYFQALTTTGQAASQTDLKVDPRKYAAVVITKQKGKDPTQPGSAVIGGQIQFPTS